MGASPFWESSPDLNPSRDEGVNGAFGVENFCQIEYGGQSVGPFNDEKGQVFFTSLLDFPESRWSEVFAR